MGALVGAMRRSVERSMAVNPLLVLVNPLLILVSALTVLVSPLLTLVAILRLLAEALVALVALVRFLEKKEKNGQRPIQRLPGMWLNDVLHFFYSPKTAKRVFEPTIRDMQDEWVEAIAKERQGLARWVRVRGVLTVLITVVVHAVANLYSIFKLVK